MNLHAVCRGIVTAVNPDQAVTINTSTGYTTAPDGTRTPTYSAVSAMAQIQALSGKDLKQLDGLNLNGTLVSMYFFGAVAGIVRQSQRGGDLITVSSGAYAGAYLISMVLEQWSDGGPASWCKVCAVLQNGQ